MASDSNPGLDTFSKNLGNCNFHYTFNLSFIKSKKRNKTKLQLRMLYKKYSFLSTSQIYFNKLYSALNKNRKWKCYLILKIRKSLF